jgi:hypothetical protein
MDAPFLCPDCGIAHAEPGAAGLGHLIRCLDCTLSAEVAAYEIRLAVDVAPDLAA